ncbi:MAG: DUF2721 domain-containing protein [Pirellulales bacterium]|nr:DUF2721 domain-containing protein [Pirellulales bacterium]MBX3434055.1 DUF2721 domain-containing protein [Pirellulales bacterium]
MPLEELAPVLQVAVGPAILISAVGLLLLTMTNRFGRVIDRTRELIEFNRQAHGDRAKNDAQLRILWIRARLLRTAIFLAASSALLAAMLVIVLFLAAVMRWQAAPLVGGLFVGCLGSVGAAILFFLRDIQRSLHALALETDMAPRTAQSRGKQRSTTS